MSFPACLVLALFVILATLVLLGVLMNHDKNIDD